MTEEARRFDRTQQKTGRARRLRRDATPWERKLWCRLQSAQVEGVSFRRQHPIGPYILDFYAPSASLAIEIDGSQHGMPMEQRLDRRRDVWLCNRGIVVLRFWNSDITENIEGVVETVRLAILDRRKSDTALTTRSPPLEKGRPGGDRPAECDDDAI